eukprot:m.314810 g.314810  ORF g.314810 m.314810 type:complete len:321 (+) comp27508_c1_seq1:626-1588(+)
MMPSVSVPPRSSRRGIEVSVTVIRFVQSGPSEFRLKWRRAKRPHAPGLWIWTPRSARLNSLDGIAPQRPSKQGTVASVCGTRTDRRSSCDAPRRPVSRPGTAGSSREIPHGRCEQTACGSWPRLTAGEQQSLVVRAMNSGVLLPPAQGPLRFSTRLAAPTAVMASAPTVPSAVTRTARITMLLLPQSRRHGEGRRVGTHSTRSADTALVQLRHALHRPDHLSLPSRCRTSSGAARAPMLRQSPQDPSTRLKPLWKRSRLTMAWRILTCHPTTTTTRMLMIAGAPVFPSEYSCLRTLIRMTSKNFRWAEHTQQHCLSHMSC